MKQLLSLMLVFSLSSFISPARKMGDGKQPVKTKLFDSAVWFANSDGAANDMTVYIGSYQYAPPYAGSFYNEVIGYFPEGTYSLTISKNTSDNTPRYITIEDPYYQNNPSQYYYWSTDTFYGSINVNTMWNYITVGFL
jgi:hypothetical protein